MGTIDNRALTIEQQKNLLSVVSNIMNYLPDSALNELLEGYEGDIDSLFVELVESANAIINQNEIERFEKFDYLDAFNAHFEDQMRIASFNYFKISCLPDFHVDSKSIEWGNFVQLYDKVGIIASRGLGKTWEIDMALPLWRMYGYRKPKWGQQDTIENKNKKKGIIITNEFGLGKDILKDINTEILNNDIIAPVLKPDRLSLLGKESIETKNGALIKIRSFGSQVRGQHPGWIHLDDYLDRSALYSREQNEKFIEAFKGDIMPALEPFGKMVVVGTPFVQDDLYGHLKKDKNFLVVEYPAVMPDGTLTSPYRLKKQKLIQERESLGSLVFSREYLVKPVSDDATIFPWEYLNRSKNADTSICNNIDSFSIKLDRVVIGCDFAKSGKVGADYSVFSVWGAKYGQEKSQDKYYLIGLWRKRGASHGEQVSRIIGMDTAFSPNKIIAESNGFQEILADMVIDRGLKNIEPSNTTSWTKKNEYSGLLSLAVLFERGQIRLPYENEESIRITDWLLGEFNMIAFDRDKGKLEATSDHDDGVMSSFFAINDLRENRVTSRVTFI